MIAPERIWLQDAGDYDNAAQFEVTWCDGPQDDADTEYVRADLVQAALDEANLHHAQAFGTGVDHGAALSAVLALPELKALVEASKGLLFAHDHGNGLEGWHYTRERMRAALRAIGEGGE